MGYILLNTLLIIPETTKLELYPKNSRNEAMRNIHQGTPVVKHPEKNSPEKRESECLSHQRPDSHTAVSHRNGNDRSDTQRPQIDTSAYRELEMLQQQSLLYKGKCIQRNHEKQNPADIYQIRDFKNTAI